MDKKITDLNDIRRKKEQGTLEDLIRATFKSQGFSLEKAEMEVNRIRNISEEEYDAFMEEWESEPL